MKKGFFRILQFTPGTYNVVITASAGFGEARYENVRVIIGQTTQLNITISPDGAAVNTVNVAITYSSPVYTTNSAIQTSVTAQKIELLPKGTGITRVLKTVPGTRPKARGRILSS